MTNGTSSLANMRFPRYFFSFCIIAFMAAAVSASVEVEVEELQDEVEVRNPLLAAAVAIIRQAVKWAVKHCAEEAAHHCKQHWKHPTELVKCAKAFLQANKGRCVVG